MDTNKVVIGVLLLLLVIFLVLAGPSCEEVTVDVELQDLGKWKRSLIEWSMSCEVACPGECQGAVERNDDCLGKGRCKGMQQPGWLTPEPLQSEAFFASTSQCRFGPLLRIAKGRKCSYKLSGGSSDQRRAELQFVGGKADGIEVTTADAKLLKAVPSKPKKGDKAKSGKASVLLIAMPNEDSRSSTRLTIHCKAPLNGSSCRLRYAVASPSPCERVRRSP